MFRAFKRVAAVVVATMVVVAVGAAPAQAVPMVPRPATGLLWYNIQTGEFSEWLLNGTGYVRGSRTWALNCQVTHVGCFGDKLGLGDFDHDGRTDLLSRAYGSGQVAINYDIKQSSGAYRVLDWTCAGTCQAAWDPVGIGDMNNDQYPDLVWHHFDSGEVSSWILNNAGTVLGAMPLVQHCGYLPDYCSVLWRHVTIGDVNGDGSQDVVWWNQGTGEVRVWLLNGSGATIGVQSLTWPCDLVSGCASQWTPKLLGDMNGDGHQDLLWYHPASGTVSSWLLDGYGNVITKQDLSWPCGPVCDADWNLIGIVNPNLWVPGVPTCPLCRL